MPRPRAPRNSRAPDRALGLGLAALVGLSGACTEGSAGAAKEAREAPASAPAAAPAVAEAPPAREATAPANGFGEAIAWRGLEEGLREAAADNKTMMLVVHASWCPKCKDLKASFFDPALVAASDKLVMVNVDQDEEPRSMIYSPDGTYVPRVLFIGADGEVVRELQNQARPRYHFFYTVADDLVGMMEQAALRHGQS